MSQPYGEDLFEPTTMSFGDHLEELRGALFKSLVGLIIGFLVALFVAKEVVKFIQSPLQKALHTYYLNRASDELNTEFKEIGNTPPEMRAMIEEEHLVPDSISVDPFIFLDNIREKYPDQLANLRLTPHLLSSDDLPPGQDVALCAKLIEAAAGADETARMQTVRAVVWRLFEPDRQDRLRDFARRKELDADARRELLSILNDVLNERALHLSTALDKQRKDDKPIEFDFVSQQNGLRDQLVAMRTTLAEQPNANETRRLNRLLLAAMFPEQLRAPRLDFVELPTWKPIDIRVQTLNAQEAFMIWLKAAFITGALLASPWIFWQIWHFVAAGLYPHEQRYVHVYLPFSLGLFLAGAALAFFFVFKPVLSFLFGFNAAMDIDPDPRISEWLGFVLFLPVGFGIAFQLPLVMLFMHRIGIFTVESYLSHLRIAVLIIFVASMLLTPADPISMLMMAVPMTGLYFLGVALCQWLPRIKNPFSDYYEP